MCLHRCPLKYPMHKLVTDHPTNSHVYMEMRFATASSFASVSLVARSMASVSAETFILKIGVSSFIEAPNSWNLSAAAHKQNQSTFLDAFSTKHEGSSRQPYVSADPPQLRHTL